MDPALADPQVQPAAVPQGADSLHEHAVNAESALEQLATGLASAGVDQSVVQTFTQMADMTRQLVKALGQGQEQTAPTAPPADAAIVQPAQTQPRTIAGAAQGLMGDMSAAQGA